jgi:hypothetical protein
MKSCYLRRVERIWLAVGAGSATALLIVRLAGGHGW